MPCVAQTAQHVHILLTRSHTHACTRFIVSLQAMLGTGSLCHIAYPQLVQRSLQKKRITAQEQQTRVLVSFCLVACWHIGIANELQHTNIIYRRASRMEAAKTLSEAGCDCMHCTINATRAFLAYMRSRIHVR